MVTSATVCILDQKNEINSERERTVVRKVWLLSEFIVGEP